MQDGSVLRDRVSSGAAVERQRQHGPGALFDQQAVAGAGLVAEVRRRARGEIGDCTSIVGTKAVTQRAAGVGGIDVVARAAGIAARQCVIVQPDDQVRGYRRPVVLEEQVVAYVERGLGAVAVLVGGGRRQRHQVVRRQARRVIGIAGVGMHHGAQLVERDTAVGRHADREHQRIGRCRAALDHAAHQRQVHRFVRGRVHQPRVTGCHAQHIVERAGAIGTKGRAEITREAGRRIGRQHGLVHGQRRLGAGRAQAGAVVLEEYLGADFGGSCGCPDQFEAANIEIGVVIALCRQCSPILDEHAVVVGRRGVFDPVAGQYAGDGGDPGRKADRDIGIVHRSVRVFDNLPGGDIDHANIRDRNNGVVCITIDEIDAGLSRRVERGDLDLGTHWTTSKEAAFAPKTAVKSIFASTSASF